MSSPIVELLQKNRKALLEEVVSRILEDIPRYAVSEAKTLRSHVEGLLNDFFDAVATGDTQAFRQRVTQIAGTRIRQGFTSEDFVRAVLLAYPAVRHAIRAYGPQDDPSFAKMFRDVEAHMFGLVAIAVNVYTQGVTKQVADQNDALARANEQLRLHEQELQREATQRERLLIRARELNQRVIESLSSGVMVMELPTRNITFWSPRLEELIGLRAEDVLGRNVQEALASISGIPHEEFITAVRSSGHLPLTKMHVRFGDGQSKHLFIRGEKLRSEAGDGREGVVLIIDDITERELLIDSFSRFVSREIVQRVLSRSQPTRLEGERRDCSVLFADLRGFTGMAEKMEPEALHELLNQFFRVVIDHISAEGGIVDKFIGDKIMAVFAEGGPNGAAQAAARASLKMTAHIAELNRERRAKSLPALEVGIGLNSGTVVMGNVGSEERMNFTVIGDAVNVADRLQSLAKGGETIMGARTRELIGDKFAADDLGEQTLRGRVQAEHVYRLKPKP